MSKADSFIGGFVLGAVIVSFVWLFLVTQPSNRSFPKPDGRVIVNDEEWRWYDTNPDLVGISPKVWVHRDGVIYEPSGVKFPKWGEALEREDDGSSGDRVTETALRSGIVHGVRRQACRCKETNRL